jgi:TPP-dependent pyruvate/acetoin dehydrogenase alpha subunit
MVERNWAGEPDFKRLRQGILAEIDEAVEWALAQPYPDPASLEENVYDTI